MTITQPSEVIKLTSAATMALAVVLAVSGPAPQEAQTYPSSVEETCAIECVVETDISRDVDTVVDKAARFQQLAQQWRDERAATSLVSQMASSFAYSQIMGMGPDAVPLILAKLKSEGSTPDHWFWALASITHDNPVPKESRGKLQEMAKAWLAWGETKGYV
ncbi:MAG: hypothetical protein WBQ43_15515 [Terriglobales bacterium]